ncbi:MAG: chemotaxis protein CheX [Thermoguttaceae bacterium]
MKVEYINPFIAATLNVFDTMAGMELRRGNPSLKDGIEPSHEVSAMIGLSGKANGTVVLSVEREVAIQVAAALLQEQPPELNADVTDAMGEMANMIAGQAKAQLEHLSMTLGLPTVVTGPGHCLQCPSNAMRICIPFCSSWGALDLEVALAEVSDSCEAAHDALTAQPA